MNETTSQSVLTQAQLGLIAIQIVLILVRAQQCEMSRVIQLVILMSGEKCSLSYAFSLLNFIYPLSR